MASKKSSGYLRYTPALVLAVGCMAAILFLPKLTSWSTPLFYELFLKIKGPPPASNSVAIVTLTPKNNVASVSEATAIAKAILKSRPSVLVLNLSTHLTEDSILGDKKNSSGLVVIGHDLLKLKPWTFSEAAVQTYSPLVSRSLYKLLDDPSVNLNLPMGGSPLLSDTLAKWHFPTTGFTSPLSENYSKQNIFSIPAFARLGHGVVANLGVEAARRALGISTDKVAYLDGLGMLFNATHVLPINKQGQMFLRFHKQDGIPHLNSDRVLDGTLDPSALKNKIVFLEIASENEVLISTVAGHLLPTDLLAEAAANLVDNLAVTAPNWGRMLGITLGVFFFVLIILMMFLEVNLTVTFFTTLLLAGSYPLISSIIFLKSSWWLSPELPFFMVVSSIAPIALSKILRATPWQLQENYSSVPAHPQSILPAQVKPLSPSPVNTVTDPVKFVDPRDPILISAPEPTIANAPKETTPRHAHPTTQATPVMQVTHPGTLTEDIERDVKGNLLRLGKYQIVRKMGFGSAGDVFEGVDSKMGRWVAIKTITKNGPAHFDKAAERFVLEAKAAGSLNHPCINTVYDFGTIGDVSYIVLEHLDGITLSQWMRNNPTPPTPASVVPWLQQVGSALDYAHNHKVIHRDLKPANLMVVNGGATIKLLDFGIAKMEDVGLTQTGMTVGTPSYMSPEQLSGFKVNAASDQYGFAVVIYQLLTYKLPYLGTKIPELCNRILKNDLVPMPEANPNIHPLFWEALKKALAKTPEGRYGSCSELVTALTATLGPV